MCLPSRVMLAAECEHNFVFPPFPLSPSFSPLASLWALECKRKNIIYKKFEFMLLKNETHARSVDFVPLTSEHRSFVAWWKSSLPSPFAASTFFRVNKSLLLVKLFHTKRVSLTLFNRRVENSGGRRVIKISHKTVQKQRRRRKKCVSVEVMNQTTIWWARIEQRRRSECNNSAILI